jgi:type IV secretion system protein TrbF
MLKRLIDPVLALRKRRRGTLETVPEELAQAIHAPRPERSWKTLFRGRAFAANADADLAQSSSYVQARRQWNERYGNYFQQARHWRLLTLSSGLVCLIALAGMVYIGTRSPVVPYLVDMQKFGKVAARMPTQRATKIDVRIVMAYLGRFIADWRSVTVDRKSQKSAIDRLYAMLPDNSLAERKLNNYFNLHSPFARATSESVSVAVTSLVPISEYTWQIAWTEARRDTRGAIVSSTRLRASLVVTVAPPSQDRLSLENPMGVYVADLNWSQQLQ